MWVLFSFLAAFFWAITNIIDKYALTKWMKDIDALLIVFAFASIVSSIFIFLLHGFAPLSYFHIGLCLLAGVLLAATIYLYFKAVQIEEVSRVVPLFYLSPLFIAIFAAIFLKEIFTPLKYFGIFLLIIGAVLISSKKLTKIKLGKAFVFMLLSSLLWAFSLIITKYLLSFTDFWTVFGYTRVATFIILLPICFNRYKSIKSLPVNIIGIMLFNEALGITGYVCITIGISLGYATLVDSLASIQPFFVLAITLILSIFYPKILKEDLGKTTIAQKLIATILMFVGALSVI